VASRAGQRREAVLLFAWNFCAVAAFFVGRSVRDALFLAHESAARLPLMYVATPLTVSLINLGYARVADRVRLDRLVVATSAILGALVAAAWLAVASGGARWIYYALYIGVEVMGSLVMMQFWTSASARFSPREAKKVFGRIAAGGTIANITIGFAIAQLAARTGAEGMLLACVGFLAAVAALAAALGRRPGAAAPPARVKRAAAAPPSADPPGTRHLKYLAPMIGCAVLASTLLDFQFKTLAAQTYAGDRVAMLRFFAFLSSGIGALSLAMQLFLTGRVLERLGVVGGLLFLPGTLGLSALGILFAPSLLTATISETGDVFRYTVNDAAMQLLYLPVPAAVRGRKKATIDGVIKPGTEALCGGALFLYRAVSGAIAPLAAVTVVATTLWAAAIVRLRRAYARSLAETLRRRRIVARAPDDVAARDVERAVRAALVSGDRTELGHALDLARLAPAPVAVELRALAGHADAGIRAQALGCLAAAGLAVEDASLDAALADPDPGVRAAAARAAGPGQLARVAPLLDAAEPAVLAAAVEALHDRGDAAARASVVARVRALLDGPGARLGLELARRAPDAELVPALVARLDVRGDVRPAVRALAAVGAAAEPALVAAVDDAPRAPGALAALGELGAAGSAPARAQVLAALAAPDEPRRAAACAAVARAGPADPTERAALASACAAELGHAYRALAAAEGLGHAESALLPDGKRALVPYRPAEVTGPAALISRALRERSERARDRLFQLLGALQPELDVATVRANLDEPDPVRRANAVELLDALSWRGPSARLKPLVLTLVDDSTRAAKVTAATKASWLRIPGRSREKWVAALLDDDSAWMVACAAYYAGATEIVAARPRLAELAADRRAVVAETAAAALLRLDPQTRAAAQKEPPMITTAEKVLFLKGIELFAAVPSEDLVEVARITSELTVDDDEVVFHEGDRGDALYFVVEGRVRVEQGGRQLAVLGERDVFGEMALLDPAPRSATAVAIEPLVLLRVGQDDFGDVLRERPEVAAGVLRVLTRRLRAANLAPAAPAQKP
jgi:hypothetical protein